MHEHTFVALCVNEEINAVSKITLSFSVFIEEMSPDLGDGTQ